MVPLWAVVVPVVPRGALPVHHLKRLKVSGQRGEGGWQERLRGQLRDERVTSGPKDKWVNEDIRGRMIRMHQRERPREKKYIPCLIDKENVCPHVLTRAWYLFWLWLLEPEVNVTLGSSSSPISSDEKNSLSFWTLESKHEKEEWDDYS